MRFFVHLGFTVEEGKEIEDEWHTFDALNIPKSHPARDVQDTFFVKSSPEIDCSDNQTVLRTHTSPSHFSGSSQSYAKLHPAIKIYRAGTSLQKRNYRCFSLFNVPSG